MQKPTGECLLAFLLAGWGWRQSGARLKADGPPTLNAGRRLRLRCMGRTGIVRLDHGQALGRRADPFGASPTGATRRAATFAEAPMKGDPCDRGTERAAVFLGASGGRSLRRPPVAQAVDGLLPSSVHPFPGSERKSRLVIHAPMLRPARRRRDRRSRPSARRLRQGAAGAHGLLRTQIQGRAAMSGGLRLRQAVTAAPAPGSPRKAMAPPAPQDAAAACESPPRAQRADAGIAAGACAPWPAATRRDPDGRRRTAAVAGTSTAEAAAPPPTPRMPPCPTLVRPAGCSTSATRQPPRHGGRLTTG